MGDIEMKTFEEWADSRNLRGTSGVPRAYAEMGWNAALAAATTRRLVVTTNEAGEAVAVTWQDDEHRILEVVWEKEAAPTPPAQSNENLIQKLMEQAQVFASAWSLVDGPFDSGNAISDAEEAKAELEGMLREAITTAPAQEVEPLCPRPCNGRRGDLTMAECILLGECGCTVKGHEYAQVKHKAEPVVWKCVRNCTANYVYDAVSADMATRNGWDVTPLYTRAALEGKS
jgi:hypothetical protein